MGKIKHILLILLLFAGLSFAFGEKQLAETPPIAEQPVSEFSQEGLHALAFIQPESTQHLVSNAKPFAFSVAKLAAFLSIDFCVSGQKTIRKNFFLQDINRCETVSLLLFPYHFFW
ncbi:hypothetical protein [Flavobacterium sp.]|uniref:hypothetical protein n=1 Tax=Flavobacterium sp. TaxID=239 RepID=UPI0039E27EC3